jgi:dolichol-phosphate mannosyltransferase
MLLPIDQSLIIIPTYNEIENIEKMLRTLFDLYPSISILIIEDGSPDGTASVVKNLMNEFKNLSIIERVGKLGLGTAYIAGFEMDCDFSHDPKQVADLLASALENDLIIGSRYIDGIRIINWPIQRLLLSYGASIYTRLITGIPVYDTTGGFKCFKRTTLEALDLNNIISNGYSFQLELNYKIWVKGFKIKEVPIIFYERRNGQSKMGSGIIFEAIFAVFRLRFKKIIGNL